MIVNACAISHPGNVRKNNEDNLYFDGVIGGGDAVIRHTARRRHPKGSMFGVFDGMGGMSFGENASLITAQAASVKMKNSEAVKDVLLDICLSANEQVCDEMCLNGQRMGSTASMLLFSKNKYFLCNIGDSPILRLRNNNLIELSHEHTEKREYEKKNGKLPEGAKRKFRLTQYIGIFDSEMPIKPYTRSGKILPYDKYVICSDGLTDMICKTDIKGILRQKKSVRRITNDLLNAALAGGGKDNITIITIEIRPGLIYRIKRKKSTRH